MFQKSISVLVNILKDLHVVSGHYIFANAAGRIFFISEIAVAK
jgi:hypothetical protein